MADVANVEGEELVASVAVDVQGAVVGLNDATGLIHEQDYVVGEAAQVVVVPDEGAALHFSTVTVAVEALLLAAPEKRHARSEGQNQGEGGDGLGDGAPRDGTADFIRIDLSHEEPLRSADTAGDGEDGHAAVIGTLEVAADAQDCTHGGYVGASQGNAHLQSHARAGPGRRSNGGYPGHRAAPGRFRRYGWG